MRHTHRSWISRFYKEFKKDPLVITLLLLVGSVMIPIWVLIDIVNCMIERLDTWKKRKRKVAF